jgi:retinol dehydrogenase 12
MQETQETPVPLDRDPSDRDPSKPNDTGRHADPHRPPAPRVALLTGGAQGIGFATAPAILEAGYHLVLLVRSEPRGAETRRALAARMGGPLDNRVSWVVADLESGEEIAAAMGALVERHPHVHLLVNNAGIVTRRHEKTPEGFERTLAVNHLGYVRILEGVLPALLAAAHASSVEAPSAADPSAANPSADVRVVQVSSDAHARRLDLTAFEGPKGFSPYGAYAQSKLLNLLHSFDLAPVLAPHGITINAVHPGLIATGLLESFFPPGPLGAPLRWLSRAVGKPTSEGAETPSLAATSPRFANVTGRYLRRGAEAEPAPVARDPELQAGVREWTAQRVGFDWRSAIPQRAIPHRGIPER